MRRHQRGARGVWSPIWHLAIAARPERTEGTVPSGGLRWGITLADVHAATNTAVFINAHMAGDVDERRDIAWGGIVEHLYSTDAPPTRRVLVDAGSRAITAWVHGSISMHGQSRRHGGAVGSAPRWRVYWWDQARVTPSPEDQVVERLTLYQILGRLTPRERAAVEAMAAHGSLTAAAESLGVRRVALRKALDDGRRRFRRLWHEGESPSRHWAQDRRDGREPAGYTAARLVKERSRRAAGRVQRRAA